MTISLATRPATPDDWTSMQVVFATAGRAAWPHIFALEFLETLTPPDRWREAIADPARVVLVAEAEGLVIGFAVLRRSGDQCASPETGELDSFYVHADFWGKGVGQELLSTAVDRLRDMGFAEATLWTAELNHRPRRIYEIAGWRLDGGRRECELGGTGFVELRYRARIGWPIG
ncbi:MAG: GNAT family N-acetyltransferase [Fimbriimonadales bacterium]